MQPEHDVVIVGGGQAGLAMSHVLAAAGVGPVVLERGRVGETWRNRWESFCFVTPNWSMQLPGQPYDGPDPDAFDPRDDIVGFLERYAAHSDTPIHAGVDVESLDQMPAGGFRLGTSAGPIEARRVVLASGAYQRPHLPPAAQALPDELPRLTLLDYSSPDALPAGRILVVGSGQSGCQISEELHNSGRDVTLSCGRAPWAPRRINDHDVVWWLEESGFLSQSLDSLPDPSARLFANILASGHGGGHDLHLRTLHELGVTLVGHFQGAEGRSARFAADLGESVAWGDERYKMLRDVFTKFAVERGIPEPEMPDPPPLTADPSEHLDLSDFGAVLFTGGFRPAYASWVNVPGAFDELGFPNHVDGASTAAPGLYFVGVHFLRTRKSSLFLGVGDDARVVGDAIASDSG
ncbi:MAG: flavin-containing monooxygenase [Solirubrobacterales bacterium]